MKEYRIERWEKDEKPDAKTLRAQMEKEGFSVFRWSDNAGSVYPLHAHGDDQSHWVVSGSIELDVDGVGKIVLNAGDRDFMPRGTKHAARVVGDEAVTYLIGTK